VVLAVFVTAAAVAGLAVERLRDVARTSVEAEARNLGTTFANMVTYQVSGGSIADRAVQFQRITDFIGVREKRDFEIIGADLVYIADVVSDDIGKPVAPGVRRDSISLTLKDGEARLIRELSTGQTGEMRQVVVPIYDGQQQIIAALVYEIHAALQRASLARRKLAARGGRRGLAGLLLALGCAAFIARSVSVPLVRCATPR
jgi:hypothetical protein